MTDDPSGLPDDGALADDPRGGPPDGVSDGIDTERTFRLPEPQRPSPSRSILSWLITIIVALLVTFVIKTWVFQAFEIPSASMVPTLDIGDRVLVSKLNTDPGRGDIIVFNRPANDPARSADDPKVLIKRVIGLPGETITAKGGHVYVNGKELAEKYLPSGVTTTNIDVPIQVGTDQLLVLGDNRSVSQDGRYFGPIDKSLIVGRAVLRIWPLSRFGSL